MNTRNREDGTVLQKTADTRIRDLLLVGLTISSGAVDAISFLALGRVFTAFMTGNIVFLGLRLATEAPDLRAVVVSLTSFVVGVYICTRVIKPSDLPHPWPSRMNVALGVALLAHAGFASVWFATAGDPSLPFVYVLISFWALAMGLQSSAVQKLGVPGVLTTVATATLIFFVVGLAGPSPNSAQIRRHAAVLAALFSGATAGGLLLVHARLYAPLLPLLITAAVVATAVTALSDGPLWRRT